MKRRFAGPQFLAGFLFVLACVLGAVSSRRDKPDSVPRARFDDATPLGGKGLHLLLSRLGYGVGRIDKPLQAMPANARVWVLLDPKTRFSRAEGKVLLDWVRDGGTLIWALTPRTELSHGGGANSPGHKYLQDTLVLSTEAGVTALNSNNPLPTLNPLDAGAPSIYWSGVKQASGSSGLINIARDYLEIAGSPAGVEIARIDSGKGRVFVAPDALLFTSYALSKPDNAVLVSNLVRAHVASGAVFFDERQHATQTPGVAATEDQTPPTLMDYLWRPPLRYALLQILLGALLWWAWSGRRLGAPVPLPQREPVTRASLFALAMGALFRKVDRPHAAAAIIGEHFRRDVVRRTGLSMTDPDDIVAARAAELSGLTPRLIERLLLRARSTDQSEAEALHDAQEMQMVLSRLQGRI